MKRNIIMPVLLIASLLTANIASYADETDPSQPTLNLSTLQRNLLTIQAQQENAKAAEECAAPQAISILGTYKGTAPGMNSAGTGCISSTVILKIWKTCGNFAKGSIAVTTGTTTVTVPVTGLFKQIGTSTTYSLSLDGVTTGTTIYEAYLGATYASSIFVVSSFYLEKNGSTTNNTYDTGWFLIKQP